VGDVVGAMFYCPKLLLAAIAEYQYILTKKQNKNDKSYYLAFSLKHWQTL